MNEQKPANTQNTGRIVAVGMAMAIGLAIAGSSLLGQQGKPAPKSANNTGKSDAFTKVEQDQIAAQVLAHPDVTKSQPGHEIEVLRVVRQLGEVKPTNLPPTIKLAEVTLLDHTTGQAQRLLIDPSRNLIVRRSVMRGTPSPSEEELTEALEIIRADPGHAKLLTSGGQLSGGFEASAPGSSPASHRYLQFQVLSPDRKHIERIIIVDLTANTIASSK
jgi:hypothetical protein